MPDIITRGVSTQSETGFDPNRTRGCGVVSRDGTDPPEKPHNTYRRPSPQTKTDFTRFSCPQTLPKEGDPQRTNSPEHPNRKGKVPGGEGTQETTTGAADRKDEVLEQNDDPISQHIPTRLPSQEYSPVSVYHLRDPERGARVYHLLGGLPLQL